MRHHIFPHHELSGRVKGNTITIWQWQDADFNPLEWVWAVAGTPRDRVRAFPAYPTAKQAEQAARAYYRGRL